MKRAVIVFILASAAVLLEGCWLNSYDVQEVLLVRDDVSLTFKGKEQLVYDPLTWQLGYNAQKCEYRASDDEMANYFVLRCETRPTFEGQEVRADVSWTMQTSVKYYERLKFEVRKTASDGTVWLWNRSQSIGVVVRELK